MHCLKKHKQPRISKFCNSNIRLILIKSFAIMALYSCNSNIAKQHPETDTLIIKSDVALLYYPDIASMDSLKFELETKVYQEAVSDYTHFMHLASDYADSVGLKKIITSRGKVLKFICKNKTEYIVNTNTLIDFWGVILFNKHFKPKTVDITMIDIEYKKLFY
jgi:ribosomal protein S18